MASNDQPSVPIQSESTRVKNLFLTRYRGDAIEKSIYLMSSEMSMAFRKHFDGMSRSLFYIRYYSKALKNQALEYELEAAVMTLLQEALAKISTKNTLVDQVIKQHQVKIKHGKQGHQIQASIIDPLANHYLELMVAADEVVRKYTALWLALVINDQQKRQSVNEVIASVRELHAQCTRISLGLRDRCSPHNPSSTPRVDDAGEVEFVDENSTGLAA